MNNISAADYKRNFERKKVGAEKYLAEHRVRALLEQITSELVLLTPNEPLDYIIRRVEVLQAKTDLSTAEDSAADAATQRPRIVCMLGGPATGKALQCALLAEEAGMIVVSPSDLVQQEVKAGTEMGKRIAALLKADEQVPTTLMTQLVKSKVTDPRGTYVLDGYPRTMEQCLALERDVAEISMAVYLKASEAVMIKRMEERQAGADDAEPQRSSKLEFFALKTIPVVQYLEAVGKLMTVDAEMSKADSTRQVRGIVQL